MRFIKLTSLFFILSLLASCSSSEYVKYLKNNTESVQMSDSLYFKSLDQSFYNNQLFFVGEIHEVETSPRIDFAMFTQLKEKTNIGVYIAEMDIAQAYYLKKYIEGSNELSLEEILTNWSVYIGSISKQYRDKWVKMRKYYATLDANEKFDFFGVDAISDFNLLRKLINEKIPEDYHHKIPEADTSLFAWSEEVLPEIIDSIALTECSGDILLLENIQFNLSNYKKIRTRDKFMYENFKRYHKQYGWFKTKIYACFGFAHTLQAYKYSFAGRIKKDATLNYSNKMVSMNALYVKSRLTVQSRALPKFLRDKGKAFTRFKFSYDSRLFMYIKGIADYKKVTKPNTISLISLNNENSPYATSLRGTKTWRIIPIWESFEILEGTVTTDYAQYILFVRNADWIIPDEN